MNKKELNKKQYLLFSVIYAASFAIYNIIVLLLFSDKNNIFWISYGFMFAGFIANICVTLYSFKKLDVEAIFMGIPLLSFSFFYFFGELFISLVFMLFRNSASTKLAVALQMIFLLIFVIFAALAIMTRDAVASVNETVDKNVKNLKMLSVDVKLLEDECLDPELKKELHKVYEAIFYSDPMANEFTKDLDEMIRASVIQLKYECQNNNKNSSIEICNKLNRYISERNQKLLYSK